MAEQTGSDMLLKMDTAVSGGPTYTTVGGMRAQSIGINNEPVDVTHQGSSRWKTLLASAGLRSFSVSGSGVFADDTAVNKVNDSALAGDLKDWQITVPGLGTFTGKFMITSLKFDGPINKEMTFSMELVSSGAIVFVTV